MLILRKHRAGQPQSNCGRGVNIPERASVLGFSAHLVVNPAAGSAATFLGSLTEAARERGIRVRELEPGQDARLAALAGVEDGAESLVVAGGDGSVAAVAGVAAERGLPLIVGCSSTSWILNDRARQLEEEVQSSDHRGKRTRGRERKETCHDRTTQTRRPRWCRR
jgi:hypothetical protein